MKKNPFDPDSHVSLDQELLFSECKLGLFAGHISVSHKSHAPTVSIHTEVPSDVNNDRY